MVCALRPDRPRRRCRRLRGVGPAAPPGHGRVAARFADPSDRDDVLQEALTRAWRRWSTFDPSRGTPSAWLCAIVADGARRRRQAAPAPDERLGREPVAAAGTADRDLDLERAVATLPRRQREVVDLRYFAGLSTTETAQVLGLSEGTVKSTLSDARGRLRRILAEEYA